MQCILTKHIKVSKKDNVMIKRKYLALPLLALPMLVSCVNNEPMVEQRIPKDLHDKTVRPHSCKGEHKSTPNSRFQIISNGNEVQDKQTGLTWQRCSLGQSWDGQTCQGTAVGYKWKEAKTQAKKLGNGYRLPTIQELSSIIETDCDSPSINTQIFPNTATNDFYWSSTTHRSYSHDAWIVGFKNNYVYYYYKKYPHLIRAVR